MDNEGKAELAGRPPGGSFTIPEWCRHRRMSISMYYKLRTQGKSPATLDVGRHKTITAEADSAWVQKQAAEPVVAPARAGLGRLDAAKNGHGP